MQIKIDYLKKKKKKKNRRKYLIDIILYISYKQLWNVYEYGVNKKDTHKAEQRSI